MKAMKSNYMVSNYSREIVWVIKIIIFSQIFEIEKWADSAHPMRNSKNLKYEKILGGEIYW